MKGLSTKENWGMKKAKMNYISGAHEAALTTTTNHHLSGKVTNIVQNCLAMCGC